MVRLGGRARWLDKAREQAEDALVQVGRPELSVWCAVPADETSEAVEEAVYAACDASRLGYRFVRVALAFALRAATCELAWSSSEANASPYHWNVVLSNVEKVPDALAVFADEKENPRGPHGGDDEDLGDGGLQQPARWPRMGEA